MKKMRRFTLIAISSVLAANFGFCDWWITRGDSFVNGYRNLIALDSLSYADIAYNRNLKSQPLYASWNQDSTWIIEPVDPNIDEYFKLVFDSKWHPLLTFPWNQLLLYNWPDDFSVDKIRRLIREGEVEWEGRNEALESGSDERGS